jgi:hypothetical protein
MMGVPARHAVRPMRRALLASVVLAVAVTGLLAPAGAQGQAGRSARRVVIVSVPTLTWSIVQDRRPPVIMRLLESSAVASLSVRTIGPRTSLGEGYLTLGAGNRATVRPESTNAAFDPDDNVEGSTAALVYERRTGQPASAAIVQLEIVDILRSAGRLKYGAEPGALGDALKGSGKTAAVVANGDNPVGRAVEPHREAALAMMDGDGKVAGGSVDAGLTTVDPASPFGVHADAALVAASFDTALAEHNVVLVEASDYARLDRYRQFMTAKAQDAAEQRALAAADRLVAHVLDRVDLTRDIVVLLSPVGPLAGERLTTFAIAGPGFEPGSARSATTRRSGFVTLPDVAPTILRSLGIKAPDSMSGTLISSDGSGSLTSADLARMTRTDTIARFRDSIVGPVSVAFIVFQVLVYAFAVLAMTGRRRGLRPYVAAGALEVLAMPPVVFLSGLVHYDRLGVIGYTVAVLATSAGLAAIAWWIGRRRLLLAPGLLVGTTLAVLLVDVVTGAHLQINTAFGYSPIVAGRFAGYGNLAFALVAMAAIVVGTMIWAAPRLHKPDLPRIGVPLAATAVLFALVLALDGLPSFGSDVGGVLATLPAFAVTALLLAGIRISWPRVLAIGVASLAAVAAFAAVDLSRPEEQRTHLGRFAQRLVDGDVGTILQRKAEANISLLTSSVWTYVIPVALAFLGFLTWRRSGFLRELQRSVPGLRPCLVGALVAGVLGFALNDSGVAVPAMMFGILLPYITWLLMRTAEPGAVAPPA